MDPIVTLEQVMATRPCYTCERIKALAGGRTAMRLSEIMALEDVPARDRVWLAYNLGGWDWRGALAASVERLVHTYAAQCGIPSVERWAQRWLSGADRSIDAAWDAWTSAVDALRTTRDTSSASRAGWGSWLVSWAAAADMDATEAAVCLATAAKRDSTESQRQVADIIATLQQD